MRDRDRAVAVSRSRRNRASTKWRKVAGTSASFLLILWTSAVGGYLNRARGGAVHADGGYWFQHIMTRLMFGLPTAAIFGFCAMSWRPFAVIAVLTSVQMIIGWGCYFDVPFQASGWTARQGVFDWLIGRQEEGWSQAKVFYHNYAGMALRGLAWTAPQGYILYHLGYGWHFAMTGCLMSVPYSFGWVLRGYSWMSSGQAWCETIWGYWIWIVMISSALAGLMERLRENSRTGHLRHTPAYLSSYISNRWLAILFEVWSAALTVVFLASTIFYSVVQQRDTRNKAQTFFGLFTVSITQLGAQIVIYTAVWLTRCKDIDLTYELRGVAILCQSPLILRNKVHFSADRFRSRRMSDSSDDDGVFPSYQRSVSHGEGSVASSAINNQPRDFALESDHAPGGRNYHSQTTQDSVSRDLSTDTDDEVDWSMVFSERSSSVHVFLRKLPYRVWKLAEGNTFTSFAAAFRLIQGAIALLGCLVVFYITVSAVLWNLHAPRYLGVCTCSQ